ARIAEETRIAEEARIAEETRIAEEERKAEEARLAKYRDKKAMAKERAYEFKQDGKWLLAAQLFERCKNDAIDASVKKRFDMETLECLSRAREYEPAAKKALEILRSHYILTYEEQQKVKTLMNVLKNSKK
ncbi:MAG: hypothetical protein RR873_07675, partial [Christensenella sp.]